MLGIELINKIYIDKAILPGTKIECNNKVYTVENVSGGTALREPSIASQRGKMVHNLTFNELLDFLNSECHVLTQFTFSEAAKRNGKMKPFILENVDYMNLNESLAYLSSISDASLLKRLLEEKVWYA